MQFSMAIVTEERLLSFQKMKLVVLHEGDRIKLRYRLLFRESDVIHILIEDRYGTFSHKKNC